jgi:hypothetical protein
MKYIEFIVPAGSAKSAYIFSVGDKHTKMPAQSAIGAMVK